LATNALCSSSVAICSNCSRPGTWSWGQNWGMAITINDVRSRRQEIQRVLEAHGAANPRVFGSLAAGRMDEKSDVDILVDFREPGPGGFAYFGALDQLERELTKVLGIAVHVSQVDNSSPTGKKILREALPL